MTVTTLYVDKDAYTRIKAPDTNYGSGNSLEIAYLVNDSDTQNGYMEFDLTSIPDAQYVHDAVLRVRKGGGGSNELAYLNSLAAQFTENTITWNNAPATNSDWDTTKAFGGSAWYEISVDANWVQSKLSSNWLGIKFSVLGYDSISLFSKEYSSGSLKAELVITYNTTPNEYYVKTSGDDTKDGSSWANAWATVNKAATTVADGKTVHIGFGTYNAEPANNDIAPVNAGAIGIKYLPETATTGGGTGSVIVEVN